MLTARSIGRWLWGPKSPLGCTVALLTLIADQSHKWWMLNVYGIEAKREVEITPFLDLVMVWNRGISYGLFQQDSILGTSLLIGFIILALVGMTLWLAHMTTKLGTVGLGLVLGGGAGNLIDRFMHGAVADFFSFHIGDFYWYVFNIADAAIVAGVIGLLYDSLFVSHKKVSKSS